MQKKFITKSYLVHKKQREIALRWVYVSIPVAFLLPLLGELSPLTSEDGRMFGFLLSLGTGLGAAIPIVWKRGNIYWFLICASGALWPVIMAIAPLTLMQIFHNPEWQLFIVQEYLMYLLINCSFSALFRFGMLVLRTFF